MSYYCKGCNSAPTGAHGCQGKYIYGPMLGDVHNNISYTGDRYGYAQGVTGPQPPPVPPKIVTLNGDITKCAISILEYMHAYSKIKNHPDIIVYWGSFRYNEADGSVSFAPSINAYNLAPDEVELKLIEEFKRLNKMKVFW